jgi:hypothetical protein
MELLSGLFYLESMPTLYYYLGIRVFFYGGNEHEQFMYMVDIKVKKAKQK